MNNSINASKFLKLQKDFFGACDSCAEAAARRSGITKDEVRALVYIFEMPEHKAKLDKVNSVCGGDVTAKLTENKLAEISGGEILLTGRGGITAKSAAMSEEKFFSSALQSVTLEELFIFESVLEKISKNLAKY